MKAVDSSVRYSLRRAREKHVIPLKQLIQDLLSDEMLSGYMSVIFI